MGRRCCLSNKIMFDDAPLLLGCLSVSSPSCAAACSAALLLQWASLAIARQLTTRFPEMLRQQSGTLDFRPWVSGLRLLLEQLVLLHFSPDESWCSRLYIAFVDCGIVVWCDETTLKLPADRHQFALQVENPLESGYGNIRSLLLQITTGKSRRALYY